MKFEKRETGRGNFAKKGEDIKNGDIITLLDEGEIVQGDYGKQNVFLARMINGDEKNINLNQTSVNAMIDAYGEDSLDWVNKKAKAWVNRENVAGKFVQVLYLTHPDQELGESMDKTNKEIDEIPVIESD